MFLSTGVYHTDIKEAFVKKSEMTFFFLVIILFEGFENLDKILSFGSTVKVNINAWMTSHSIFVPTNR